MESESEITSPIPPKLELKEVDNTPDKLTFYDALREMMEGKKVTKLEWKDKHIYGLMANEFLSIHINYQIKAWSVSLSDIEGTDWVVLEDN